MLADYKTRSLRHRLFIERIREVPYIARQKRRTNWAAIHAVAISLGVGGLAGMKFQRDFISFPHANRWRQDIVQGLDEIVRGNWRFGCKRCDLGERVHTSVGASGALRQDLFTGQAS